MVVKFLENFWFFTKQKSQNLSGNNATTCWQKLAADFPSLQPTLFNYKKGFCRWRGLTASVLLGAMVPPRVPPPRVFSPRVNISPHYMNMWHIPAWTSPRIVISPIQNDTSPRETLPRILIENDTWSNFTREIDSYYYYYEKGYQTLSQPGWIVR